MAMRGLAMWCGALLCLAATACGPAGAGTAAGPGPSPGASRSAAPSPSANPRPAITVTDGGGAVTVMAVPVGMPDGTTPFPGGLRAPAGTTPIGPSFAWSGTDGGESVALLLVTGDPYAVLRDLAAQFRGAGFTASDRQPPCDLGPLKVNVETTDKHRYLVCHAGADRWLGPGRLVAFDAQLNVSPPGGVYQATMYVHTTNYDLAPAECATSPSKESIMCATTAPAFVAYRAPAGRAPFRPGPAPAPPTLLGDPFGGRGGDPRWPVQPDSVAAGPAHSKPGCSFGGYTTIVRDDGTRPDLLADYVRELTLGGTWGSTGDITSPTAAMYQNVGAWVVVATSRGDDGARYVLFDGCHD